MAVPSFSLSPEDGLLWEDIVLLTCKTHVDKLQYNYNNYNTVGATGYSR